MVLDNFGEPGRCGEAAGILAVVFVCGAGVGQQLAYLQVFLCVGPVWGSSWHTCKFFHVQVASWTPWRIGGSCHVIIFSVRSASACCAGHKQVSKLQQANAKASKCCAAQTSQCRVSASFPIAPLAGCLCRRGLMWGWEAAGILAAVSFQIA